MYEDTYEIICQKRNLYFGTHVTGLLLGIQTRYVNRYQWLDKMLFTTESKVISWNYRKEKETKNLGIARWR